MRELVTMWRYRRMVLLTVVVTLTYGFLLVPFKGLTIIPGFTSVRPASALPVVCGLLFGPAGAWGAALGNVIGDVLGGTVNPASPFGFAGNLLFGMVGYKLWGGLGSLSTGSEPTLSSGEQFPEYVVVAVVSAVATASVIGYGGEVTGVVPFAVFSTVIVVNNAFVAVLMGPPLLYFLYPVVRDADLLYVQVMPEAGRTSSSGPTSHPRAALAVVAVVLTWFLLGIAVGFVEGAPLGAGPGDVWGTAGSAVQIALGTVMSVLLLVAVALCSSAVSTGGE